MAFGVTAAGFIRKLAVDIVDSLSVSFRARISKNLATKNEKTFIGNFVAISSDELSQVWEAIEAAYYQFDPDNADENGLIGIGKLTGVERQGAAKGLVTVSVNLDAGFSEAAGNMVAHVAGDDTNRWQNRDTVTSVGAGFYDAVFESVEASSKAVAEAGTLTVIATPVAGWNSITNNTAATPGTDIESLDAFRVRREIGLAVQGSGSAPAIAADLVQVEGVLQARVFENRTQYTKDGMPPHSIRCLVWSGSPAAADPVDIATTIFQSKDASTPTVGALSEIMTDDNSEDETIAWDEPTEIPIAIYVEIYAPLGLTEQEVKDKLLATYSETIGGKANYDKLRSSLFTLSNVEQIPVFTLNATTADIIAAKDEILTLADGGITVVING